MDALSFAKMGLDELKSRLAQRGDPLCGGSINFHMTPEEIVQKFFDDQGLSFGPIDVQAVLALADMPTMQSEGVDLSPAPPEETPLQNG